MTSVSTTSAPTPSETASGPSTTKPPPPVELDLSKWNRNLDKKGIAHPIPSNIARYQTIMSQQVINILKTPNLDASEIILRISNASLKAARRVAHKPKGKAGWTLDYLALKTNYVATCDILREDTIIGSMNIPHSERRHLLDRAIMRITHAWEDTLKKLLVCHTIKLPTHRPLSCASPPNLQWTLPAGASPPTWPVAKQQQSPAKSFD